MPYVTCDEAWCDYPEHCQSDHWVPDVIMGSDADAALEAILEILPLPEGGTLVTSQKNGRIEFEGRDEARGEWYTGWVEGDKGEMKYR